jgi:hypothetical protein
MSVALTDNVDLDDFSECDRERIEKALEGKTNLSVTNIACVNNPSPVRVLFNSPTRMSSSFPLTVSAPTMAPTSPGASSSSSSSSSQRSSCQPALQIGAVGSEDAMMEKLFPGLVEADRHTLRGVFATVKGLPEKRKKQFVRQIRNLSDSLTEADDSDEKKTACKKNKTVDE